MASTPFQQVTTLESLTGDEEERITQIGSIMHPNEATPGMNVIAPRSSTIISSPSSPSVPLVRSNPISTFTPSILPIPPIYNPYAPSEIFNTDPLLRMPDFYPTYRNYVNPLNRRRRRRDF